MSPEAFQQTGETLRNLLTVAWLLPLAGFAIEIFAGWWGHRLSKTAAYMAVCCIGVGFLCSATALGVWGHDTDWGKNQIVAAHEDGEESHAGDHDKDGHHDKDEHHDDDKDHASTPAFTGEFYTLGRIRILDLDIMPERFTVLVIPLDYYIDSLTLVMFTMVTLIATCIHVFALGYMSDELTEDYVDHQVHVSGGGHLHRPGRFYRFFSFMSLFCFSMLGLVLAGNIFQVFIFWELVGISSYLLIGFYVERKSASTAANKAFIMNRVGDFGFLIGLMVLFTYFGTFRFGPHTVDDNQHPGLFQMVRGESGQLDVEQLPNEEGELVDQVLLHDLDGQVMTVFDEVTESEEPVGIPYYLLVIAGLGIFAGCIGKSAQFPLQTWLPDAMEGPTPVSALVHSATMVAAGVYLTGRFYPMFTPEVLLVIAYIGCITLFVAATIAMVATDIKRVLAYSTISQLGYMMLGIGVGGWAAGLFHLITHAFFKSLMFLASGSVIVGCHHEQEMPKMGGLWRKMPITAFTMLVGVIAISGLAIPGSKELVGQAISFSGYHSKDAIVATALAYSQLNGIHFLLFLVPLVTAGITAFYMFRLWFYTFSGKPRDEHVYEHAKESPWVMTGPLLVLSVFAAFCAIGGEDGMLFGLLGNSEPAHAATGVAATADTAIALPGHHEVHAVHDLAGGFALLAAFVGTLVAYLLYGLGIIDPGEIKRQFAGCHTFLVEKWRFDELYDVMFVRPVHIVASWATAIDKKCFDGILHAAARGAVDVSRWDRKFDEGIIDGLVNLTGTVVFTVGRSLRVVQTGRLRQYIMFIAVGVLLLFVLLFTGFPG
jgi:NADH-quinone oxidoreductase subunit L